VELRSGEEYPLLLDPVPIGAEQHQGKTNTAFRRLAPPWFWGSLVVTVSLATVASILGVQTLSLHDDYQKSPSLDLLEQGEQRRDITNVFWALSAIAAGGSTALFFLTDFEHGWWPRAESLPISTVGLGFSHTF
jgi:hypothetical protein